MRTPVKQPPDGTTVTWRHSGTQWEPYSAPLPSGSRITRKNKIENVELTTEKHDLQTVE